MITRVFLRNAMLTVMDVVVFCLCVDKGLQPVALVGACYIALRLFARDAGIATNYLEDAVDETIGLARLQMEKFKESSRDSKEELSKI